MLYRNFTLEQRRSGNPSERNAYIRIADELRSLIASGQIQMGRYLPTERELQDSFGASRSTIRRALSSLIEAGWAENVPSKGVVACDGTRAPAMGGNVALIQYNTFVQRMLVHQMGDAMRQRGFHLVPLGFVEFPLEDALDYAVDQGFVGAIVWSHTGFPSRERIEKAQQRLPIVSIDHGIRGISTDLATFDYFECARLATHHLIQQGRRRIGVTGMLDMLDITHERFCGYMQAMFEAGLTPSPIDFVFTQTSGRVDPDPSLLAQRLSNSDAPDALLVLQDLFAPSAIEAARMAGRRVPEDLAIMTIGDDIDLSVDGIGMSAVALDWSSMAASALELFFNRIENPRQAPEIRTARHGLIVRGLCGAPRSDWVRAEDEAPGFRGQLPISRTRYVFSSSSIFSPASPKGDHGELATSKKRTL